MVNLEKAPTERKGNPEQPELRPSIFFSHCSEIGQHWTGRKICGACTTSGNNECAQYGYLWGSIPEKSAEMGITSTKWKYGEIIRTTYQRPPPLSGKGMEFDTKFSLRGVKFQNTE